MRIKSLSILLFTGFLLFFTACTSLPFTQLTEDNSVVNQINDDYYLFLFKTEKLGGQRVRIITNQELFDEIDELHDRTAFGVNGRYYRLSKFFDANGAVTLVSGYHDTSFGGFIDRGRQEASFALFQVPDEADFDYRVIIDYYYSDYPSVSGEIRWSFVNSEEERPFFVSHKITDKTIFAVIDPTESVLFDRHKFERWSNYGMYDERNIQPGFIVP